MVPPITSLKVDPQTSTTFCRYCSYPHLTAIHCPFTDALNEIQESLGPHAVKIIEVPKRRTLFHQGDPVKAVYLIRQGSAKTGFLNPTGDDYINGYLLEGDLVGLDAIYKDKFQGFCTTLEDSLICEMDIDLFRNLLARSSTLQQRLNQAFSQALDRQSRQQRWLMLKQAEQRLACFLLDYLDRIRKSSQRDLNENHRLILNNKDIASCIGIRQETLCRLLSQLAHEGILIMQRRRININDGEALKSMAQGFCQKTAAIEMD